MPLNGGEKKRSKKKKMEHTCFIAGGGAKMGSSAVVLDIMDFLKIRDMRLVPGELPLRYPVGFFGTFSLS